MIDISTMDYDQLVNLSAAIKAEARRRARILADIAGKQGKVYRAKYVRVDLSEVKRLAEQGLCMAEVAKKIGCHHSRIQQIKAQHNIKFAQGKRGPRQRFA